MQAHRQAMHGHQRGVVTPALHSEIYSSVGVPRDGWGWRGRSAVIVQVASAMFVMLDIVITLEASNPLYVP